MSVNYFIAARRIQRFVRCKVLKKRNKNQLEDKPTKILTHGNQEEEEEEDALNTGSIVQKRHEYEVVLWHRMILGLCFCSCKLSGWPIVEDTSSSNQKLPGMTRVEKGDYLLRINDFETKRVRLDTIVSILTNGERPALLCFRKKTRRPIEKIDNQRQSSISSLDFPFRGLRGRIEELYTYLLWKEEDGPLGLNFLPHSRSRYPEVIEVRDEGAIRRESSRIQVQAGDLLVSVNNRDVTMVGFADTIRLLRFAPKPLILTLRKKASLPRYASVESSNYECDPHLEELEDDEEDLDYDEGIDYYKKGKLKEESSLHTAAIPI
jgi:hypothetical protein